MKTLNVLIGDDVFAAHTPFTAICNLLVGMRKETGYKGRGPLRIQQEGETYICDDI